MLKKKITILLILIFITLNSFSLEIKEVNKIISSFLNNGNYVYVERKTKTVYYPKSSIIQFSIEGNLLKFMWQDNGNDYETEKIDINKFQIQIDENKNIIIQEK